ncbi:hypothetical protein ABS71_00890 [bacterium SCN 62-11]|nr:MAG: hypothetical protein ABS71_00890 [bacterium SCN 62-11]
MPPINTRVLKQGLEEMAKLGYPLSYISARLDQHVPPVEDHTVEAWVNGTLYPTSEQIIYIASIVRVSSADLRDLTS